MEPATRRQLLGMVCLGGLAAGAAAVFSPADVVSQLEHLATHPLQFVVALTVVYLFRPFLLWPVSSVAIVLGYVYGPFLAFPLALAGAALTAMPPFSVARYASTELGLFGSIGETGRQFADSVGETRGVLAARLSPVPGDPVSYAAGLSEVSVSAFLFGTVIGEIPWAIVTILAGDSMRTLSVTGFSFSPPALLATGSLGVVVLAGPLYKHFRGDPVAE